MKVTEKYTVEDLLIGCKSGNRVMQEKLYSQTSGKMMAICLRYAKDRMEAEDVLQLGYIKIFQKVGEFRNEGSAEGWMRRIMVNTAIESYRKNLRMLHVVQIEEAYEQPSTGFDFSSLGMKDLLTLISQLADGYRIVFNMFVIEGYSHREIAETLGITEATSKSQLSRARTILKSAVIKMEGIQYATYAG